jgi:hypothetical protein
MEQLFRFSGIQLIYSLARALSNKYLVDLLAKAMDLNG